MYWFTKNGPKKQKQCVKNIFHGKIQVFWFPPQCSLAVRLRNQGYYACPNCLVWWGAWKLLFPVASVQAHLGFGVRWTLLLPFARQADENYTYIHVYELVLKYKKLKKKENKSVQHNQGILGKFLHQNYILFKLVFSSGNRANKKDFNSSGVQSP